MSEARLQEVSTEYQKLQSDLAVQVEKRTRLDAQSSENEMVKKEFANFTANNIVYKLVGPVLIPQDQNEAKNNVETRLDFIRAEIKRADAQIKIIEESSEKKKTELLEIQSMIQQARSTSSSVVG